MSADAVERADTSTSIMCSLTPEALKSGRAGLLPGLRERATNVVPTAHGYQLFFDASSDVLMAITRTIDAERQCCRWLRFELAVWPDGGPIELTLSGPEGAREFLAALFEQ
jgi:hypothetical protein